MGHGSRVSEDCGAAIKEAAAAWLEPQILERLRISLSLCMSENGGRSLNRPTRALLSAFSAAVCIVALDKVLQIFVPLWGGAIQQYRDALIIHMLHGIVDADDCHDRAGFLRSKALSTGHCSLWYGKQ